MFSWLKKDKENKKQDEEIAQLKKQLDEVNEKLKKVTLEKSSPVDEVNEKLKKVTFEKSSPGASNAVRHQSPSQVSLPPYAQNHLPSGGGHPQLMNLPNFQTPPPPFQQFQPHPVPQNNPQSYSCGPPPYLGPVGQQQKPPGSVQSGVSGQPPPPYYSNQGTTSSGPDTRRGTHFRGASQDTRHYQATGQRGFRNPKFERGRRNDRGYHPGKPRTDNRNPEENNPLQNQRSHQNDLVEDRPLFLKTEDNMNPQDRNRPTYFRGWRGRGRGWRGGLGRGGYNNSYNNNSNTKRSNEIAYGKSQQCQPRSPCNEKKSEDQARISKGDSGSESQSESDNQEESRDTNLKSSFKTNFKKPRPKPRTVKNTEWLLVGSDLAGVSAKMSSSGSSSKAGVSSPSSQTNTPDLIKFVTGSEEELTSLSLNIRKSKPELVLSRNCMGPNDVFKKFIGSEIPSFTEACRMNIDLETKVRDIILSSGPPTNQLKTPKTLLDIVMYKVKHPGAKAVLL